MVSSRVPAPPPLEANDQLVAAVITAGWAVALVVLLVVVQLALRATLLRRNGQEADPSHWSAAARESVQPGAALSYRPGEDQ